MNVSPLQFCTALAISVLTTATALTFVLLKRSPENATLRKVSIIVRSWWLIVGCFLGALLLGKWGIFALFYLVNMFGLREYLRHSSVTFKAGLGAVLAICITGQFLMLGMGWERFYLAYPAIVIPIVVPLTIIVTASVTNLPVVMATSLGLVLFSYFLSYIPALAHLHTGIWSVADQDLLAIALLFLITESNDIFQFMSGKLLGRRKILPAISPNKTEAGFIGGFVLTPLLAWGTLTPLLGLQAMESILIGLCLSFVGVLGDLIFSTIKRYVGTKDFSDALPGHGGLLDRIDSLVLTAPVYFHLLLLFKGVAP